MNNHPADNAFQNAQNYADAARLHVNQAQKKPGADQDELEVLEDLAVAMSWLAIGLQKLPK